MVTNFKVYKRESLEFWFNEKEALPFLEKESHNNRTRFMDSIFQWHFLLLVEIRTPYLWVFNFMGEHLLFSGKFGDARYTEPGGDALRHHGRTCHTGGWIKWEPGEEGRRREQRGNTANVNVLAESVLRQLHLYHGGCGEPINGYLKVRTIFSARVEIVHSRS
jgi:hypothetical protein